MKEGSKIITKISPEKRLGTYITSYKEMKIKGTYYKNKMF